MAQRPWAWSRETSVSACSRVPDETAAFVREWADAGQVNILGGCCGSSPAHIAAMAKAVAGLPPRVIPTPAIKTRLAGLEPMTIAA